LDSLALNREICRLLVVEVKKDQILLSRYKLLE
jgi:hypothetical protein